jgi:hypothetical protein
MFRCTLPPNMGQGRSEGLSSATDVRLDWVFTTTMPAKTTAVAPKASQRRRKG